MNDIRIKSPFSNSIYSTKIPANVGYFTDFVYSPFIAISYSKKYTFKKN